MRAFYIISLLPLATRATEIVISNDDGWAEINIRTFYDALTASGEECVISAPADNESGTGSSDTPPTPRTSPCEFNSCPANSGATGSNSSMPRFDYVNSFPVTSIKYGIDTVAPQFFDGPPQLAVAGPNVGGNLGPTVFVSGTVGAATYAATAGVPAIAFSGESGEQTAWDVEPVPAYSGIYAALAANFTELVLDSGTPYLPDGVYLNVNFPEAGDGTACVSAKDFRFVLSRIMTAVPVVTPDDVETCGTNRLPTETSVVGTDGCFVSVSVGNAASKSDSDAEKQKVVLDKLGPNLECLPDA